MTYNHQVPVCGGIIKLRNNLAPALISTQVPLSDFVMLEDDAELLSNNGNP
jgi:hypothetical protein